MGWNSAATANEKAMQTGHLRLCGGGRTARLAASSAEALGLRLTRTVRLAKVYIIYIVECSPGRPDLGWLCSKAARVRDTRGSRRHLVHHWTPRVGPNGFADHAARREAFAPRYVVGHHRSGSVPTILVAQCSRRCPDIECETSHIRRKRLHYNKPLILCPLGHSIRQDRPERVKVRAHEITNPPRRSSQTQCRYHAGVPSHIDRLDTNSPLAAGRWAPCPRADIRLIHVELPLERPAERAFSTVRAFRPAAERAHWASARIKAGPRRRVPSRFRYQAGLTESSPVAAGTHAMQIVCAAPASRRSGRP
jgi:hypothetical protein